MLEQLAYLSRPVLEFPYIRRTRRNHGLEHATITVLTSRVHGVRMAGRSNDVGFILLGDVPTEQVESAVREALRRMRNGEHQLAIHPGCGTNLVTAGAMTTMAGLLGLGGMQAKPKSLLDRLPFTMVLMMFAVLFSQPLGMSLQKHFTTEGDPGDLEIVSITRREVRVPLGGSGMVVHSITTQGG